MTKKPIEDPSQILDDSIIDESVADYLDSIGSDPGDDDGPPSLYNLSVYGQHTYHHVHGEAGDEHKHAHPGHEAEHEVKPSKLLTPVAVAIFVLLLFYAFLLFQGLPQKWTELSNTPHGHAEHPVEHGLEGEGTGGEGTDGDGTGEQNTGEENTERNDVEQGNSEQGGAAFPQAPHGDAPHGDGHGGVETKHYPPLYMIAPFAILLLCVAFFPLIPATERWWESNTNRFLVALICGAVTLGYYAFFCDVPVEQHWPSHGVIYPATEEYKHLADTEVVSNFAVAKTVFMNAIFAEYIPFIVLLFSLFVITGGIRISGNFKATPRVNTSILGVGAAIASFIGTTGAAMLLIRFLLETNRRRKYKVHTVILFIFTVCNSGGCLTPLGDPPLFLGYLRGVPFEWTMFSLWPAWLFLNTVLLTLYFLWDSWYYQYETKYKMRPKKHGGGLLITGWGVQLPLLLGVVASVALIDPSRPVPFFGPILVSLFGSDHPPFYLRESIQLALAACSLLLGSQFIRKRNAFNFLAIGEVAALFFGIFICMQVPLQVINVEGKGLVEKAEEKTGLHKELLFFWTTASLSLVLDNAPTYIVFFETARTLSPGVTEEEARKAWNTNTIHVLREELNHEFNPDINQYDAEEIIKLVEESYKKEMQKNFENIEKANAMLKKMDKTTIRALNAVPLGKNGFIDHQLLLAAALGTVFVGGMTYIANGPNFMVKAIAEQAGVKMPSFFGFFGYACLLLLPWLIVTSLLFL